MKSRLVKTFLPLIVIILIFIFLSAKNNPRGELFKRTRFLLGTVVEITVYDLDDRSKAEAALDAAFAEIKRLEDLLGRRREGSDVWKINNYRGTEETSHKSEEPEASDASFEGIKVSSETIEIIEEGVRFSRLSGGAFDITLGRLMELWNFEGETDKPPAGSKIKEALKSSGAGGIRIDPFNRLVASMKNAHLDLGGIAKGYIIDKAGEIIVGRGLKNFIINAGGDMLIHGKKGGRPWRIGLQHPRRQGEILARIEQQGKGAIVTSGDYERYFIYEGKRFHHILDPATGYPATDLMSVTVTAGDAKTADALSTAVFVLGAKRGMELIESMDGVEGMLVDGAEKVYISGGLKGRVKIK